MPKDPEQTLRDIHALCQCWQNGAPIKVITNMIEDYFSVLDVSWLEIARQEIVDDVFTANVSLGQELHDKEMNRITQYREGLYLERHEP